MRCRRSHKLKRRTAESPQRAIANIFVVLKNLGGIRRRRRGQSPSESTNVKLCKLAERKVDIYRQFTDWYAYIGDKYHADGILDRLRNRSYFVELKERSYRERTQEALTVRAAE